MFRRALWLAAILIFLSGVWAVQAQTATPTPAPTEPPVIMVIQPTPGPTTPPPDSLGERFSLVWQRNWEAILLAVIMGIVIGVFFKRAADTLTDWAGRLFHFLFDRFAATPLLRWRFEKEYRATLADAIRALPGGRLVDKEIPLDKMYVQALLTQETRPDLPAERTDYYRTRDEIRRQQKKDAIDPWEAVRRFSRYVVLGGPGIGKTTYLRHLAYQCALRGRVEVDQYTPIFIKFNELLEYLPQMKRLEEAFPAIFARYNFPNADPFIQKQLKAGRCLILLDGLDEVPTDQQHQQLITLVQSFAERWVRPTDKNILVVSCRKYSYAQGQQLEGFQHTEVMELDPPAIERFIHSWFADSDTTLADELLVLLKRNKRFLELSRNPLLLLLIADHYERERHLPQQRADLYQNCIHTRIIRWNTQRGTHLGKFGERHKQQLLQTLALTLFREEKEGFIRRDKLFAWLETFSQKLLLPPSTTPEDLFEEIARTSGLIQEWAIDRYGFSHHTLQEYFAAVAVSNLPQPEALNLLIGEIDNSDWQEIIFLYCGLTQEPTPFIRRLVEKASLPDAPARWWLLAGQCLSELSSPVTPGLRQTIAERLLHLLRPSQAVHLLSQGEMEQAGDLLKLFAADLLPALLQPLIESQERADWLLAGRLLPDTAPLPLREAVSQKLLPLSRSTGAEERQAAITALGSLGVVNVKAVAALLATLQDNNPDARAEAALALARLGQGDEATAAALHQMAQTDPADTPRHAALEALLALRQEKGVGMVYIPAGEFLMGSDDRDKAAKTTEKPQHSIYLPAYFIDRTPVTNGQYRRFIDARGYANPAYWPEAIAAGRWKDGKHNDWQGSRTQPYFWDDKKWNGDEQPVVGVTWYEAMAYARWAGKRLPTEAEWEKAARGTDGRLYPWAGPWAADHANSKEAGLGQTSPVGAYSPAGDSPYGVADMAGNVWEWCSTRWWNEKQNEYGYPYTPDDGREDLSGGDKIARVFRGGSWYNEANQARCAARGGDYPLNQSNGRGFRCCAASSLAGSEF